MFRVDEIDPKLILDRISRSLTEAYRPISDAGDDEFGILQHEPVTRLHWDGLIDQEGIADVPRRVETEAVTPILLQKQSGQMIDIGAVETPDKMVLLHDRRRHLLQAVIEAIDAGIFIGVGVG